LCTIFIFSFFQLAVSEISGYLLVTHFLAPRISERFSDELQWHPKEKEEEEETKA
jgi:hypothetical protein